MNNGIYAKKNTRRKAENDPCQNDDDNDENIVIVD